MCGLVEQDKNKLEMLLPTVFNQPLQIEIIGVFITAQENTGFEHEVNVLEL